MNDAERMNYSYLGDGVYAYFDGFGIWLRTHHHTAELCDDKIYIEPSVFNSLHQFVKDIEKRKEKSD